MILDTRTRQCTAESGPRPGDDGAKRKNVSKTHVTVDTLGNLLAVTVTPGSEQEQDQVGEPAAKIRELTKGRVKLADVDQGCTGQYAADAAA